MPEEKKPYNRYAADKKYDAKCTKHYGLKLNLGTDADLIAQLDRQESVQGYIKRLIRDDIDRKRGDRPQE